MEQAILRFFESIRCDFLDAVFLTVTFLGEETFIIAMIALFYWVIDKKTGEFMIYTVLFSSCLNGAIKDFVKRPRPFEAGIVTRVESDNFLTPTVGLENSYSFPSGHSQNSASFFAALTLRKKRLWLFFLSSACVVAVMCSRLYLGVHYPSDVLVGAVLGILVALLSAAIYRSEYKNYLYFTLAAAISILLLFSNSEDTFKAAGSLLGASIGLMIEQKFVGFTNALSLFKKTVRVALGLIILLGIKLMLGLLPNFSLNAFLSYFILIFFATGVYPFIFKALKC